MQNLLLKMAVVILTKLLTESLVSKLTVRFLWYLSQKTETKLDDGIVDDIAKALDVTDYK